LKKYRKALPLLCAALLCLLTACGGSESKVRDDLSAEDVSNSVAAVLTQDSFATAPDSYISGSMKMDLSGYKSSEVKINSKGVNIDEIGVFQGNDAAQAAEIKQAVEDYLQRYKDRWVPAYMPGERPKLDSAEVKVIGNYVMYAILSDSDRTAAFDAFEKVLLQA
jgi:hypothetical protein